jgi:bifunctional UDP-N-acetylglucosamine pyrophosphorylase/glucosamine-1-phosphate N-acetyltransferase
VVADLRRRDLAVAAVRLDDPGEMQGINSRADLAAAARVLNRRVLEELMASGVSIRDPRTTWVDPRAEIGHDAILEPGVVLRGVCHVGAGARIGANCVLDHAAVGAGETIPPLTYLTGK